MPFAKGEKNLNWKGGIRKRHHGYTMTYCINHHFADVGGYVYTHRLVFEETHKCCLLPWADVHHIDDNTENNNPDNLEGILHGKHRSRHMIGNKQRLGLKHSEETKRKMSEAHQRRLKRKKEG